MTANRIANDTKMRTKQLNFMVDQLEEVYEDDDGIKYKLKKARELLEAGSIYMAAGTLQNIITSEKLIPKNHNVHKIIIENTRKLGYQHIMTQAGYEVIGKMISLYSFVKDYLLTYNIK